MSQGIFSTINPNTTSGTQLATILDDLKEAVVSNLSGTTRPTELDPGGTWLDTTNELTPNFYWSYKIYDGTNDIELFRINLDTLNATLPAVDAFFEIQKTTVDIDGALLKFIKQRVANNGQVLDGDTVLDIQAVGRGDDSSNPIVGRMRVEALDNMTATTTGAAIIFESTPQGSATIQETFRIIGDKMGIGTALPDTTLDVEGTGIQSTKIEDSVNPAEILMKKKRATGFGATQIGDSIGKITSKTTDDAGAANESFFVETVATEAHTSTNQGTRVDIKNTDIGTAIPSTAMQIGSVIEDIKPSKINALEMVSQDVASAATIIALDTTKSIIKLTGSTATELQGIDATGNAKVVTIHNGSTADLTLKDQNVGAAATDRMILPDAADLVIGANQSVSLFYSVSDTRWKIKSSSVGGAGGSGEGGINYIKDADAETSNINVNVTGNITKDFETVAPLFGSQSHIFTIDTLATVADYFEFNMNDVDLAIVEGSKKLNTSFWYNTDVNYTNDDIEIDNTYSLRGYVLTAPSVASNIVMDKIKLSPDEFLPGAIRTPFEPFAGSVTGSTSGTLVVGTGGGAEETYEQARDGDEILLKYAIRIGTSGATDVVGGYLFNVPAGIVIAGGTYTVVGYGDSTIAASASPVARLTPRLFSNAFLVSRSDVANLTAGDGILFNNANTLHLYVRAKVVGWAASNLISTQENLFRNAKVRGEGNAGTVMVALSNDIDFTQTVDNTNSWSANSLFTAPATGTYKVKGVSQNTGSAVATFFAYVNGIQTYVVGTYPTANQHKPFAVDVELNKGDTFSIKTDTPFTLANDPIGHWISIIEDKDQSIYGVTGESEIVEASGIGVAFPLAANTHGDLTQIELPPGEWDIAGQAAFYSGAGVTTTNIFLGVGTISGPTPPTTFGDDYIGGEKNNTALTYDSLFFIKRGLTHSVSTTYYLKSYAGGAVGPLAVSYKITARRIK
jgi:hypothetical protein